MDTYTAQPVLRRRFVLGEGPLYDGDAGQLSWVDIKAGTLYVLRGGALTQIQTGQYLGAAIPTLQGRYVALMATGAYLLDERGLVGKLHQPDGLLINHRFNDGKCDARGRLWAGTIALFPGAAPDCRLYRFEGTGGQHTVLTGVGASNGLAWSKDNRTMYFIDTAQGSVDAFAFDLASGRVGGRHRAVRVADGFPDGMAIDEEDKLWVAIWGKGQVRRYDPRTGHCLATVNVPAAHVSSCCFGESDRKTLYITTSGEGFPEGSPDGRLFACRLPVPGTKTQKFDEQFSQN